MLHVIENIGRIIFSYFYKVFLLKVLAKKSVFSIEVVIRSAKLTINFSLSSMRL